MPTASAVSAAALTWAVANTNIPGDDTALLLPSSAADPIGNNTPAWNQVQNSLADLLSAVEAAHTYAKGTLTFTPGTIADDKVVIGGVYYQFAASATSDGSAAGTTGNPWQVKVGATNALSLANLAAAIGATGVAGTNYSTALTAHATVDVVSNDATHVVIKAKSFGAAGNAITTTVTAVSSADGLAWAAATLTGGTGDATSAQAAVDDWVDGLVGYPPVSLDDLAQAEVIAAVPALKTAVAALY